MKTFTITVPSIPEVMFNLLTRVTNCVAFGKFVKGFSWTKTMGVGNSLVFKVTVEIDDMPQRVTWACAEMNKEDKIELLKLWQQRDKT